MEFSNYWYIVMMIGIALLVVSLEWNKIKKLDVKRVAIVLIILFFLGTALTPLLT